MACGAGLSTRAGRGTVGGVRGNRRKRLTRQGPQVPDVETRLAEALQREAEALKREAEAQEQLSSFLRSPRVTGRTDDDLTLLLAACGKLA